MKDWGNNTIGIVGGGQLARMLTLAAIPLGIKVIVLTPTPNSPAAQAGAEEIIAKNGSDQAALDELASRSDVITVEFEELFDISMLEPIAKAGKPVYPKPSIIELIKDKLLQKEFLHKNGISVGPFARITSQKQAEKLLRRFDDKMVIKTRRGGYDGNGNAVVEKSENIATALKFFSGRPLYAEKFIPFTKELAVMVVRSTNSSNMTYPVVETHHERNICIEVLAPANVREKERKEAEKIAIKIADLLNSPGTFGIEMFLTKDGKVFVNEIAPRVHNSGHYTIEATRTSQFEQHIRAVTGLPLGSTSMVVPAASMINILGERNGPTKLKGLNDALKVPYLSVHIYGKSPTKIDRKMGHITATGRTINEASKRARLARQRLNI